MTSHRSPREWNSKHFSFSFLKITQIFTSELWSHKLCLRLLLGSLLIFFFFPRGSLKRSPASFKSYG